jgi:hypothetical protein
MHFSAPQQRIVRQGSTVTLAHVSKLAWVLHIMVLQKSSCI